MPDKIAMSRADRASARASRKADQVTRNISPVVEPDEATHMYAELRLFFAKNCHKFTDEVLKELHSILVTLNQANHIPKSSLLYQIAGTPARHSYWAMGKQVLPHKNIKVHKVLGTQYTLLNKDDMFPTLAITAMLSHLTCYLEFKESKCSNCQVDAKGKRPDGTKPIYPQCAVAMSSFTHEPDDRIFRQCTCCAFRGTECDFDSIVESAQLGMRTESKTSQAGSTGHSFVATDTLSFRDMEPSTAKPVHNTSYQHPNETEQDNLRHIHKRRQNPVSLASPSSRKRDIDQVEQISLLDGNDDRLAPKRKRTRLDKTALECPVCKSTRSCMHHINMPATPNIDLASHSHVGSPSRILVFKVSKTILESFAAASTPVSKASNHVEKGSTSFGKSSAPCHESLYSCRQGLRSSHKSLHSRHGSFQSCGKILCLHIKI